jgi:integrase/recombinase XerD
MQENNFRTLKAQILQRISLEGACTRNQKSYSLGLETLARCFEQRGCFDYDASAIDECVAELRKKYEQGEIPKWRWSVSRRSGEVLKVFHDCGSLELPRIPNWKSLHHPLHRAPTAAESEEEGNIFALIEKFYSVIQAFNLSQSMLKWYQYNGIDPILHIHIANGSTKYFFALTEQIVEDSYNDFQAGKAGMEKYQCLRKVADMLNELSEKGTLTRPRLPRHHLRQLSAEYDSLLTAFEHDVKVSGRIKATRIGIVRSAVRVFLFELEDIGINSIHTVTLRIVSEIITRIAERYKAGISTQISDLKHFFGFLYTEKIVGLDFRLAIPQFAMPRTPIREGFSDAEISKLLSVVDTSTVVGKRDYAMMLLSSQTGLRNCDVRNLKFCEIDWHMNEIRITQVKTGRPLTLPLPIESGNAIADYILNARPQSQEQFIFLSTAHPFSALQGATVSTIIGNYISRAGISTAIPHRGFHSFRRSFGKRLLQSEIPVDMLCELLGDRDIDSVKPYIAVDEIGLKKCALGITLGGKESDAE